MRKIFRLHQIAAACIAFFAATANVNAQNSTISSGENVREKLLMDEGWRFSLGHLSNGIRDYDAAPAGVAFNYFSKAGRAEGAAAEKFNDSDWQIVNLPHDWAVELPFDARGSHSHGYRAIGKNFPENSIGWYRRHFDLPQGDFGKRIFLEFEGVFRDSQVWVNGFYLGRESSGYTSFTYDISDYLNYGGENTVAVRVDASLEEGWFYEGAGIYRHVWLVKTPQLHIPMWGTFVTTDIAESSAVVSIKTRVENSSSTDAEFDLQQDILDADGKVLASGVMETLTLKSGENAEYPADIEIENPHFWSLDSPYMHKLVTTIRQNGKITDRYETPFGIRTIRWDPENGFFLNNQHIEIKGTNNHQDHAGVGVALPDSLNYQRIEILKEMGCNAYRTSHNPASPALLDACDRLGMLVLDETRETGINAQQLSQLRDMILRDRNHPSVILWSTGNEEWSIEGNEKGARITRTMQNYARRFDNTRPFCVAISGGWGAGSSTTTGVMGFNYYTHGDMDAYHAQFPDTPCVGTEESSSSATRGIYVENSANCQLTAYDTHHDDWNTVAENSLRHYAERPWAAGAFRWTGFDYRGEPNPFAWPAVSSQYGILDTCGFPKDVYYYYQAAWIDKPVLHLLPHWNWTGKEGQPIDVWVFSNCEEVQLELNGEVIDRRTMPKLGHLEWKVPYKAGVLVARGYLGGKQVIVDTKETTDTPACVKLSSRKTTIAADGDDVALVTVEVLDNQGRQVPTADNLVRFDLSGPGKIIGVGNGDSSSHEPDKFGDGKVWQRKLFSGLAQVIVQSERGTEGTITLTASSNGLKPVSLTINAVSATLFPSVPVKTSEIGKNDKPVPVLVEIAIPLEKEKTSDTPKQ
jgi:beta-galactosidase